MVVDFKEVIHGEQILLTHCAGKTLKDMFISNEMGIICTIFDDNTFIYLEKGEYDDTNNFEDSYINYSNLIDYITYTADGQLYYNGGIIAFMIDNGLFNEDELRNYLLPLFEEQKETEKQREIAYYQKIKEKYNLN